MDTASVMAPVEGRDGSPDGQRRHPYALFSPAGRLAFLWMCLRPWTDSTAVMLAAETGTPRATAQRAMAELRDHLPMKVRVGGRTGRALVCRVGDPYSFAEAGAPALGRVPVGRVLAPADAAAALPLAGLSALATRSRIAAPVTEVRACSRVRARALPKVPWRPDADACEVLVLPYDPEPLAAGGVVDPATMALTCDGRDRLVMAALEEALEDMPWLLSLV